MTKISILIGLLFLATVARSHEEKRVFIVYDSSNGLATNTTDNVTCLPNGRMLATTRGHVNFFDGGGFSHVDPLPSDFYPLPQYYGHYQVYFDRYNHLWIKNDRLMACLDLMTEKFVNIADVLKGQGIQKPIHDIFGDGISNLWYRSGQQLFSPAVNKTFDIHSKEIIQDIDVYEDRLLLLFHIDGSVGVYDYRTGRFLYQDHAFTSDEPNNYLYSCEMTLVGHQYFQARNADDESFLLRYDIEQRQWTRLLTSPLQMNAVYAKDHLLYIATNSGYIVYDTQTDESEHIQMLQLSKGRTQQANIRSLTFDYQGGMWIGTEMRGLLYAKPYPSPFKTYLRDTPMATHLKQLIDRHLPAVTTPLPRKVNSIFTDSRGWKWTASFNGLELEKPNGDKQLFTHDNGLTNDVVHSIVEDRQHDIWVSTSFGICLLRIRHGVVVHIEPYINQDNVPNETFLNGRAVSLGDSIIMESLDHMIVFTPARFHVDKFLSIPLSPQLVQLAINGNDIEAGEKLDDRVVTDKAVSRTDVITVDYNENSVLMIFTGLNYLRPIQTYYRVRIKGVPGYENWRVLSCGKSKGMVNKNGHLRLPLLSLAPGSYQVELQASFFPGIWPDKPRVWLINVEQPWWRTTGLYLTLGGLLVVLLLLNFLSYNRNLRMQMKRANDESDLLSNIRSYAARCEVLFREVITPHTVVQNDEKAVDDEQYREFADAMLKIVPHVNAYRYKHFSVSDLASVAHVDTLKLYSLLSDHLTKSPRLLMVQMRLEEAARLLRTTKLTVEQIAMQCKFVTPNFFIASFYHYYRQTPEDYRNMMPR